MRSMIVMLLVSAVGWSSAGCAAQAQQNEGESEGATSGSTASALQKGGGGGTVSCPGGGAPSCVTCSDAKCIWACAGGYTCETSQDANTTMCSVKTSTCRTLSFSVGSFAGMVAY